jgi:hypothetical protein
MLALALSEHEVDIALVPGKHYEIDRADTPTARQNRAFHALVQEFYASGAHSYNVSGFAEFRNCIKRDFGAGFASYKYVEETPFGLRWAECEKPGDIPETAARDKNGARLVAGKLKSWADYTKKERTETIGRLISAMTQAGVNSRKFDEILAGMGN